MNSFKGEIIEIKTSGSLSLVYVNVKNIKISCIVIDTPKTAPYLIIGTKIAVVFKETEVIIGKGNQHEISMQNKFTGTILSVMSKDLLSKIVIDTTIGKITSIITTNAVNQLNLTEGVDVTAMVKTNEILLAE